MKPSNVIFYLIVLFMLFVALGDRVFPKPLSTASLQTRTTINNFFIGLLPKSGPKLNPNERTEKAVEQQEKEQKRN
jgi:hypothetical protein